jgi:uncharacterized protein (UPF0297 family)
MNYTVKNKTGESKMNASKDFSKQVNKSLKDKGYKFYKTTWLEGNDGSYMNGERGYYLLDKNGTSIIRTYLGVLELAKVIKKGRE